MSRDTGFEIADVDVGILDDPKVRALVRTTRDEGLVARCLVAYISALVGSWAAGDRLTLEASAPIYVTQLEDLATRLQAVGLLDDEHRIPDHAWRSWFGPAAQRRDDRRFEGMVGGLMKSLGMTREAAVAEARRRQADGPAKGTSGGPRPALTRSESVSAPSVPSEGESPRVARDDPEDVAALLERWPHVTLKQRRTLHDIADRHGGTAWAVAIIRARPVDDPDPFAEVLEQDRAWMAERRSSADRQEAEWAAVKAAEAREAPRRARELGVATP